MRKPSAVEKQAGAAGTLKVLYASPTDEDHLSLQAIVGHSRWMLFRARDLGSTLTLLREHEIAVLLCERDLLPGTWTDVLAKPFDHIEVVRSVKSAWQHWYDRSHLRARAATSMSQAS